MRHLIFSIAILLSGCQSPLVATRSYSFDTTFVVNGKQYEVKTPYTCHYENSTWLSAGGKYWHIREGRGVVRAIGLLEDGTRFEAFPIPRDYCPTKTESIDVRLFVEKDGSQIESFDRLRNLSAARNVEFIDTKLTNSGSGLAAFVEYSSWPPQIVPAKRYYTAQAVVYQNTAWKNKPEIVELIKSKKILWLENGKTYPFSTWTENDVAFAKLRQFDPDINGYTDHTPRLPLAPDGENWVFSTEDRNAIQWHLEPLPSSASEERAWAPSEKFKRWIIFKGSHIEIPLRDLYRTFYQPEYDRLLEFRVEHVDLW